MITLFRRIRQKLIDSVSVTKYLLYALGEILLVVIGILIALQVNNWNEERIKKSIERELLLELQSDLHETKGDLLTDIETVRKTMQITDSLYMSLYPVDERMPEPYSVPIWFMNFRGSLFPKVSAYQSINSRGIHIIRNDSLRNSISDLYELRLTRIQNMEKTVEEVQKEVLNPIFFDHSTSQAPCSKCVSLFERYPDQVYVPFTIDNTVTFEDHDPRLGIRLEHYYLLNQRLIVLYKDLADILDNIDSSITRELSH